VKTIGEVTPVFADGSGHVEDTIYLGGSIVMLSRSEVKVLRMLQDACEGDTFNWSLMDNRNNPDNIEMSNTFRLVYEFSIAKFAINEFKGTVDRLDDILMKENEE